MVRPLLASLLLRAACMSGGGQASAPAEPVAPLAAAPAGTRTCKPELARGARCEPVPFGVEDSPCYLGECDAKTRRCAAKCPRK